MTTSIFIDGEAGTTGLQIRERLATRSDITLIQLDEKNRKDASARKDALATADIAILCLPDPAAIEAVALAAEFDTRIIDASSAHRVADGWVYGFPEMTPDQPGKIANAKLVTNPGCWPQGYIASMRPLVDTGIIPTDFAASYHGISGYSGGGKSMIADYENPNGDMPEFVPYALQMQHKHVPEMRTYAGLAHQPIFQPSVGKFAQGMIGMTPIALWSLPKQTSGANLQAALADYYKDSAFVHVEPLADYQRSDEITPEIYRNTNEMHLSVFANDEGDALIVSVYDNLGKGASGAAVQNLNLMMGMPEDTGLR